MKKEIHIYRLTDFNGKQYATVVDDPSDTGSIGGYGEDGKYHQYDSYELWHAYDWAEKLGMKLEYGTIEIEIKDSIFQNKA